MTYYSYEGIARRSHGWSVSSLAVLAKVRLAPTEQEGRANYDLPPVPLALINHKFIFIARCQRIRLDVHGTQYAAHDGAKTGAETGAAVVLPACGSLITTTSAKRS